MSKHKPYRKERKGFAKDAKKAVLAHNNEALLQGKELVKIVPNSLRALRQVFANFAVTFLAAEKR